MEFALATYQSSAQAREDRASLQTILIDSELLTVLVFHHLSNIAERILCYHPILHHIAHRHQLLTMGIARGVSMCPPRIKVAQCLLKHFCNQMLL